MPIPAPAKLPPADSGPIVYVLIPCFEKQGGSSVVEAQTYLYYMNVRPSLPSQDKWVPYDSSTEQTLKEDFKRLWATAFLDDLTIEVKDYAFTNGVIGKIVIYHMEERAAREDRRLRRLERDRADEDRRETARRERPGADGFVHQRQLDPPHQGHHPLDALREGLSRQHRDASGEADGRAGHEDGAPDLHHRRRAEIHRPRHRLRRQQGGQRSQAETPDEGDEGALAVLVRHRPRHLQGLEIRRRRRKGPGLLPRQRLRHHHRRQSRDPHAEDVGGRQDARHPTGDSGQRRAALQGRHVRVRRQQGGEVRGAEANLQGEGRRVLQREDDPQRPGKGPRSVRLRRLLGDDRLPDVQAPRRSGRQRLARGTGRRGREAGDRRHHDAHAGRRAVLRQPHHVHRQHRHARSRHPPRDPAGREAACSTRKR